VSCYLFGVTYTFRLCTLDPVGDLEDSTLTRDSNAVTCSTCLTMLAELTEREAKGQQLRAELAPPTYRGRGKTGGPG